MKAGCYANIVAEIIKILFILPAKLSDTAVIRCGYHGALCKSASGCMNVFLCVYYPIEHAVCIDFAHVRQNVMPKAEAAQSRSPQFTQHVMLIKLIKMLMKGTVFFTVSVYGFGLCMRYVSAFHVTFKCWCSGTSGIL